MSDNGPPGVNQMTPTWMISENDGNCHMEKQAVRLQVNVNLSVEYTHRPAGLQKRANDNLRGQGEICAQPVNQSPDCVRASGCHYSLSDIRQADSYNGHDEYGNIWIGHKSSDNLQVSTTGWSNNQYCW